MSNLSRTSLDALPNRPGIRGSRKRTGVCVALTMALIAGCGTGTYNERMKDRLEELRAESNFLGLLDRAPYEISDPNAQMLGVFLRLPKGLATEGRALRVGYKDEDNLPIDERRIQPPFVKLRGFCLSYELFVEDEKRTDPNNREMPVYGYFAVTDAKSVEQQELLAEIRQALADEFADNPAEWETDWETLTLVSPDETSVNCQRIRVEGPQLFDCVEKDGEFKKFEGRFDLYVYSDDTYHVMIGWRAPTVIDNQIQWMDGGETSLATLFLKPTPPPPDEPAGEPAADPAAAEDGTS